MGGLFSVYTASTEKAKLFARHQIEVKCTAECGAFRMGATGTAMLKQMEGAYARMRTIVYITAIGGGVAFFWLLYLIWRKSRATQASYLYFYIFVLVVLALLIVFLALLVSDFSSKYEAEREKMEAGGKCVTDAEWAKLPNKMHSESDMDSERRWAITFLALGVLCFLVALFVLYWITTALAKL